MNVSLVPGGYISGLCIVSGVRRYGGVDVTVVARALGRSVLDDRTR